MLLSGLVGSEMCISVRPIGLSMIQYKLCFDCVTCACTHSCFVIQAHEFWVGIIACCVSHFLGGGGGGLSVGGGGLEVRDFHLSMWEAIDFIFVE